MTELKKSEIFLEAKDDLALLVNKKANELFSLLQNFDTSSLAIKADLKSYFVNHHLGKRLYFSIQNSAHIIYGSINKSKLPLDQISIVDYGAGLGTLYLLAGMLPLKRVIYNDYLPDWKESAEAIATALNIKIYEYITGDIDAILQFAEASNFKFDIVASRNVIEHIYSLPFFYAEVYKHNPNAIIFSTTSANFHNPAMWLKHYLLHKKIEKTQYLPYRKTAILKLVPSLANDKLIELAALTRGKGLQDFLAAIQAYENRHPIEPVQFLRTNTCLPDTGYWCEHLLSKKEYQFFIEQAGFKMEYIAGYWDTHYRFVLMNILGKFLNSIIKIAGRNGILFSPFVNVIAYKR